MEIEITNKNFQNEIIKSSIPVLVDFWAPWCGPCKMIAPHLEEISKQYADKLKVAKINVDDASDIATRYNVMSIPTLLLFKNGEIMDKKVGALSKSDLEKMIQPYLG